MTLTVSVVESRSMTGATNPSGSHSSTATRSLTANRLQLLIVHSHSDATNPPPAHVVSNSYGFTWDELYSLTLAHRSSNGDTLTHYSRTTILHGFTPGATSGTTTVDFGTLAFADDTSDRLGAWTHKQVGGFTTPPTDNGLSVIRQGPIFDSGSGPNDGANDTITLPDPILNAQSLTWLAGLFDDLYDLSGVAFTPVASSAHQIAGSGGVAARNSQFVSMTASTNVGPLGGPFQAWNAAAFEICETPEVLNVSYVGMLGAPL